MAMWEGVCREPSTGNAQEQQGRVLSWSCVVQPGVPSKQQTGDEMLNVQQPLSCVCHHPSAEPWEKRGLEMQVWGLSWTSAQPQTVFALFPM